MFHALYHSGCRKVQELQGTAGFRPNPHFLPRLEPWLSPRLFFVFRASRVFGCCGDSRSAPTPAMSSGGGTRPAQHVLRALAGAGVGRVRMHGACPRLVLPHLAPQAKWTRSSLAWPAGGQPPRYIGNRFSTGRSRTVLRRVSRKAASARLNLVCGFQTK